MALKIQNTGMQGSDGLEHGPCSGIKCEKVHSKSGFPILQNENIGMQGSDGLEHGPCSGIKCEKVHSKSGFPILQNESPGPIKLKTSIDAQQFSCKDEFASNNVQAEK